RKLAGNSVRARHPHLRDVHSQYARHLGDPGVEAGNASAGDRRSESRCRPIGPCPSTRRRGRRGRSRWVDRRSASGSCKRPVRRRAIAHVRCVRGHDADDRAARCALWTPARHPALDSERRNAGDERLVGTPGVRMMEMRVATPLRVAYQGEPGAYGEMAIAERWRGIATAMGSPTFADAITMLGRGRADFAVIPVWNSTIGEIQDTGVLLTHHASRLETVSEITVPVVHCLLALPDASLTTLRYVGSHPTALAQCRRLFASR